MFDLLLKGKGIMVKVSDGQITMIKCKNFFLILTFIIFAYSFLPAPTQLSQDQLEAEEKARSQRSRQTSLVSSRREPPPYGYRKGWIPRLLEVSNCADPCRINLNPRTSAYECQYARNPGCEFVRHILPLGH